MIAWLLAAALAASAQTQGEMNERACASLAATEKTLLAAYKQVLARHKGNEPFLKKLKLAQRAWERFRDAQLELIYPGGRDENGSVYPMCSCAEREALTTQRTEQLRQWLSESEGDVCAGSRAP